MQTHHVSRAAKPSPTKPALRARPLLSVEQASDLEAIYKVLANDVRLRLLHALVRAGELCVTDLAGTLDATPQAISNQLQRLADRKIVQSRRERNNVYYRIVDPCIPGLLDLGLCLLEDTT